MPFVTADQNLPVDLSIIVVSYNSRQVTLDAIESLLRNPPDAAFEVLVFDNASSDGSADAIGAACPGVRLIRSERNLGFAAGNNAAAEVSRGRRLLLLNPDTISLPGAHVALWRFAESEPERRIWGGRTLFADHSLNPTSCWRRITLWSLFCSATGLTYLFPKSRLFNWESYGAWPRDTVADVDIVTGCYLLIDTALWRQLGGFDPAFFMYAEEADLCLRARQLGARPGITPDAQIVHLGGVSEPNSVDKVVKIMRGRVTLMRKHWTPLALATARALMVLWSGMRMVGSRFLSGPQDGPGTARDKWGAVWARRSEWLAGYD